jgi:inorganic pyrophosphatase
MTYIPFNQYTVEHGNLVACRIPSSPGKEPPWLIYVVIEIPKGSGVKYEADTKNEILYADRMLPTSVVYPCNYGFIPKTMERDSGDPVDVFVIENEPLFPFSVISVRPLGVILTEDQDGRDNKVIAVPENRVDPEFANIKTISDIPLQFRKKLEYFVNHHKDLEEGKFVRLTGWGGRDLATKIIQKSVERYQKKVKKKTSP